mmetsp:Transcript_25713/g.64728  ORF Transcript_25713/g.64728 Transcript_25713/m.64728 type:complete len:428 (+) Transcript_25713:351-1634(+)
MGGASSHPARESLVARQSTVSESEQMLAADASALYRGAMQSMADLAKLSKTVPDICEPPTTGFRWETVPRVTKAFIGIVIANAVFIITNKVVMTAFALEGKGIDQDHPDDIRVREAIWLLVLMVCVASLVLYFAINAVIWDNLFQLYSFMVASGVATGRYLYELLVHSSEPNPLPNETLRFCNEPVFPFCAGSVAVICAFQVIYLAMFFPLKRGAGENMYKRLVAGRQTRIYRNYQIFLSFFRFDLLFHFLFVFTVSVWQIYVQNRNVGLIVGAAFVLAIDLAYHLVLYHMTSRQKWSVVWGFFVSLLSVISPIMVLFCVIFTTTVEYNAFIDNNCSFEKKGAAPPTPECAKNWYYLLQGVVSLGLYITLGILAILARFFTQAMMVIVVRNYDREIDFRSGVSLKRPLTKDLRKSMKLEGTNLTQFR